MLTDIEQVWLRIHPLLERRGEPTLDIPAAERALAEYFALCFGGASSFALPEDYRRFLEVGGGHGWKAPSYLRWYDFWLGGTDGIVEGTRYHGDIWRPSDGPVARHLGMWVYVASYNDHHSLYLCCDRDRGAFGVLGHFEDRHPWMGGGPDDVYPSFVAWLAGCAPPEEVDEDLDDFVDTPGWDAGKEAVWPRSSSDD